MYPASITKIIQDCWLLKGDLFQTLTMSYEAVFSIDEILHISLDVDEKIALAENTNFTNVHGLPEDHYTTAYDMAKLHPLHLLQVY